MNIITLLIVITGIFTYQGFQNLNFFEKYKFQVYPILKKKEYFRLISSAFLHADWGHFIFNMISLYFFNHISISFFGTLGVLKIYFGSILLGNILSLFLYKKKLFYSAVGASAGVSGIIFASVAISPTAVKINFLPGWLFGVLYFGYSVYMILKPQNYDNIGHSAHLGGSFFGLAYVLISFNINFNDIPYILIMLSPLLYFIFHLIKNKNKF